MSPRLGSRSHYHKKNLLTRRESSYIVAFFGIVILLFSLVPFIYHHHLSKLNHVQFGKDFIANAAGKGVFFNNFDSSCVSKINSVLTEKEKEDSLDILLCNNNHLAEIFLQDRAKIRQLERRVYLSILRSYRLSGLICNNQLEPSIPAASSKEAFKCLPKDYRRKACMDGRTRTPDLCASFKGQGGPIDEPYIPEAERPKKQDVECKELSVAGGIAKCKEVRIQGFITPGQLAKGVVEANILTATSDRRPIWRKESLDYHLSLIKQGGDVSPIHYPGAHQALQTALDFANIKDKSVAIFGSISPWVESIVHHNGAKSPTMTVDYNQPISYDDRMKTELMSTMLENLLQFDVIVSYSSIEHDGQGRYGDPLDPDGDLAAMKECWLKVAPGGRLLLHVPMHSDDTFFWYSQRQYGPNRLPILIRGWYYEGLATSKKIYGPSDEFVISEVKDDSPVLILQKPSSVDKDEVLDISKFGGLKCNRNSCKCGTTEH